MLFFNIMTSINYKPFHIRYSDSICVFYLKTSMMRIWLNHFVLLCDIFDNIPIRTPKRLNVIFGFANDLIGNLDCNSKFILFYIVIYFYFLTLQPVYEWWLWTHKQLRLTKENISMCILRKLICITMDKQLETVL